MADTISTKKKIESEKVIEAAKVVDEAKVVVDKAVEVKEEKTKDKYVGIVGWILYKINGKKTTIAAIVGALIVFALGRGYIQQDAAQLIANVMVALGFAANVVNSRADSNI